MGRAAIGLICAVAAAWACSSGNGGTQATATGGAGAGGNGGGATAGTSPVAGSGNPSNVVEYKTIVNVVDAKAVAEIESVLSKTDATKDYTIAVTDFYAAYPDEYDFIYLILDHEIPTTKVSASFAVANRPVIQGTGIERPSSGAGYPSRGRLKGVAGFQYAGNLIPPFAHETAHYWANHLDPALGFGKDHDNDYGTHWGPTSVYGELGGFNGATLKCSQPAGALPPACQAEANGRYRYTTSTFGANTNSFMLLKYAPLELYMMGLVGQSEVATSFSLLQDASVISYDSAADTTLVEAAGIGQITMASIIARHGVRAAAAETDKHFTSAFVLVTAAPASQAVLDNVVMYQETFGNHQLLSGTSISFETLTGGRATLETRIGRKRTSSDPAPLTPIATTCNVLKQDCGRDNVGCYDLDTPTCYESMGKALGAACQYTNDCVPGAGCLPSLTSGNLYCAAYCDPSSTTSAVACSKLCPDNYTESYSAADFTVNGAFCIP